MHDPKPLQIRDFNGSPFALLGDCDQLKYLHCYLLDLGTKSVLVEPYYFDRDYLAEFSAFYGTSSRGYPNICQRWHFFGEKLSRKTLRLLLGGNLRVKSRLQSSYFGFSVVRPISVAPLGRTVLSWYPDLKPYTPRNSSPSRLYHVHIAGIQF